MIELQNLTIANNPAAPLIENQSLTLPDRSLTALIGRNGCGKSTLLRTMSGLQKPLSGNVLVNNIDVATASARQLAETIAVISSANVRVSNLTCRELVGYGRSPHTGLLGRLSADDNIIVDQALASVGMTEFASRKVTEISDGESRRIMLACALAQQTPVILLDEPTSFLDVPGRYEIARLLSQIARTEGKTIVYSTHELEPALRFCDTIVLMRRDGLLALPPERMRESEPYLRLMEPDLSEAPRERMNRAD